MGQVFSLADYTRKRIPRAPSAHDEVLEQVRDVLVRGREGVVVAASFIGSCAYPDCVLTARSDVDVVVVYRQIGQRMMMQSAAGLVADAARNHVPLSIGMVSQELAATAHHHMVGTVRSHLARVASHGASIVGDVTALLSPGPTLRDELAAYTTAKLRKLQEGIVRYQVSTDRERSRLLQKLLEAPIHVARKHLEYLEYLGNDDSKSVVISEYSARMPQELVSLFKDAIESDAWYDEQLRHRLRHYNPDAYGNLLGLLADEQRAYRTLPFLEETLLHLARARS